MIMKLLFVFILLYPDLSTEKNRILYYENNNLIKQLLITFKFQMHSKIIFDFFFLKNANAEELFMVQSPRCDFSEHPCLETMELQDGLLLFSGVFHFFYFTFIVPISFSLCFPICPRFLVAVVVIIFQVSIKCSVRDLCVYIYICVHTHTHTHIYIYMCVCVCVCVYIYIYIHIYTY